VKFAFKEWAVIVESLGRGDQILILRKGGISEGAGGFKPEHSRFFLFPTLFHQQRECVIESAQKLFDEISTRFPGPDRVRIEYWAEVVKSHDLASLAAAEALRGQHAWRDEVIAERFDWGRAKRIHALVVRTYRLEQPAEFPMAKSYGGCKSWIELEHSIATSHSTPVLQDDLFAARLERVEAALRADLAGQN